MIDHQEFRVRAREIVRQLTRSEKLGLLTTHQEAVPRLNLPEFYIGGEVARGYIGRDAEHWSTVFPQPIGLAATFHRDLLREIGRIAGDECRAYFNAGEKGHLCVWGPTVDMERDPRWGRTEEAYGEDVLLTGELTAAYTAGLAGDDPAYFKTVPTLKHFCANNREKHRSSENSILPPRLKYEYYYAAFMPAIRYGGARSVMTAYNEINGIPALCNPDLNRILKDDWGMWFAVTDGADFQQTVVAHRYCGQHSAAYADAVKAGCDIMTDNPDLTRMAAEKALADGLLTEDALDRAIENVIYARLRLGMGAADCPYDSITKTVIGNAHAQAVNQQAAEEQIVLLKNDGLLPLRDAPQRIAVVGALADENLKDWYSGVYRDAVTVCEGMRRAFPASEIVHDSLWDIVTVQTADGRFLCVQPDGSVRAESGEASEDAQFELQDWGGGWRNLYSPKYAKYLRFADDGTLRLQERQIFDWFTRESFRMCDTPDGTVIEEMLQKKRMTVQPDGTLRFASARTVSPDCLFSLNPVSRGIDRAKKLAADCGTVIFCTGNHPVQTAKECYDRRTIALDVQAGMAQAIAAVNPQTVMLLISGYPYAICAEQEALPAILWSSHAGAPLGTAAARVISGAVNPAGRLPMTWYRSEAELPAMKCYDIVRAGTTYLWFRGKPLYPFGYGLSYAAFRYHKLELVHCSGGCIARVTVENIAQTDGDEVVQVYFTVPQSDVIRPAKKLCGFLRVRLAAGERRTVDVPVPAYILQIYDTRSERMLTELGVYRFFAGGSSADLPLTADLEIAGEKLPLRRSHFRAEMFDFTDETSIGWSRVRQAHYVREMGWGSFVCYDGVAFSGMKTLTLTAAALLGAAEIRVQIGETEVSCTVPPADSFDAPSACTAALPECLPDSGTLMLCLGEGTALYDITLAP